MTTTRLQEIASCLSGYDPQALRVELAQDFIGRLVPRVAAVEKLALRSALGRVLAEDIVSPLNVPAGDNSAMDGYALRGSDLSADGETRLQVAGTSFAGGPATQDLAPGQCQRIMTGALMPPGLDTVVPQEFTRTEGDTVVIPAGLLRAGDNRRLAGEDLALGQVALAAGKRLRAADLGLLASLGRAEVPVRRRLRVAILSTGDELRSIGEPLPPGCVYDSNRYTLWALLNEMGADVLDLGVVRDDPAALREAFGIAAANADAIISSGGVSVGEADHTKRVMAELGEVLFWKIAMRPGRPMAIGRIKHAILFGLPGNPVAVMVTFYAFVREALLAMSGASAPALPWLRARSSQALRKKAGRTEYQRGIVSRAADGEWQVAITGNQGSGILSSMSQANGLVVLGHEQGHVAAGDWVDVMPFEGLNS
jgi:molybdopterin molybdotransferase